jgi:phosphate starvation-inducible membrane PsiE
MKNIELKSTFENLANLEKGDPTLVDIYSFEQILAANLSWNRARIKFLARFLVALFQVQTVNLSKIASVFAGDAKVASNYKRLQRFVRFFLFLKRRWRA